MDYCFCQISENGAISFEEGSVPPPQVAGASLYQDATETVLIAPFWTDSDLGLGGTVRYEIYEPDGSERRERLELVSGALVNQTEELDRFDARWMLLVEWRDCQPRGNTVPGNLVCRWSMPCSLFLALKFVTVLD